MMRKTALRVKDPFLGMVELIGDRVRSLAKRLLDFAVPVGLDQVLEIPTVGRGRVRNVCWVLLVIASSATDAGVERTVVGEPSLQFSFVPFVVDCYDVSSTARSQLHREIASSPALFHQLEAPTASVVASKHTRPVARLNFILFFVMFFVR
jgi:hypothetical protein